MKKTIILALISFGLTGCGCRHYTCDGCHHDTHIIQPVKVVEPVNNEIYVR